MSFPKKGLRKITVDEIKYAYRITGNDMFINFAIGLLTQNGQLLIGDFSYYENRFPQFDKNGKINCWHVYPRIEITPKTIRQVIAYGLKNGWKPKEKSGAFRLKNVGDEIELNLKEAISFPELEPTQFALNLAMIKTGQMLDLNKELYLGEGEIYHILESLEQAKAFARKSTQENSEIEAWILTEKEKAIMYISSSEEKEFR